MKFRELVRKKKQLPREDCAALLTEQKRGVLSVLGDGGYPYGTPMDHYYSEDEGVLYFHCGRVGHRLDALRLNDKASYCCLGEPEEIEGSWAKRIRSVIVFGRVEIIEDREKMYDIARKLSYKFTKDDAYIDYELEHSGPRTLMFAVVPEHITGKRVTEK